MLDGLFCIEYNRDKLRICKIWKNGGDKTMVSVSKDMIIADIIQLDPNLIGVLVGVGMHCVGCPSAQGESLEEACLVHGLNADEVVAELNNFLENK